MMNPDMSVWTGRDDTQTEGPNALRWWQCVKPYTPDAEPGIVLIGFACDEGVRRNGGRVGAKDGPRALRKALANMAYEIPEQVYDTGDIECIAEELEESQQKLATSVMNALRRKHLPVILGGGHETSWGTFQGLAQARPGARIGILNLDSHFDLRPSGQPTSGNSFSLIADFCKQHNSQFSYLGLGIARHANTLAHFDRARELGADWLFDEDPVLSRPNKIADRLLSFVDSCDIIHLSLDLDVLPSWIMPAVSAPAARGVALDTIDWMLG